MKKYASYLLTALVCFLVGAFFKFALIGYRVLAYGFWLIAAAAIYYMVLRILEPKAPKVVRFFDKLATYGIIVFCFLMVITIAMIASDADPSDNEGADYAIVLGAGVNGTEPSLSLTARLKAAEEYARENPDCLLILSGGQGNNENITEAECMRCWLTARGIDESRLILEDRATSTEENLAFSAGIIAEREPEFSGKVCVISEVYHITRAKLFAAKAGLKNVVAAAGWTGYPVLTANYFIREALGVWHYLVFSR